LGPRIAVAKQLDKQMDTTAIFRHLQEAHKKENTVFLLSNHLYQTIAQVWAELPGIKLVYEPLSNYNQEYLALLSTLDITIKCSNQDLLENLTRKQDVLIGTENLTSTLIKSAYNRGFNNFAVSNGSRNMDKIANVLGNDFGLTREFSKEEKTETLLKGVLSGNGSQEICLGVVESLSEVRALKDQIMNLRRKLPAEILLSVELGQEIFHSTSLIATKIIGTEIQGGQRRYDVDMSMFEEFVCYLDAGHNFTVHSQPESRATSFSSVYGNTGDDDDLILEGKMGELDVGDWILIGNVGQADCRGLDLILLDKDFRVVTTRRPSQFFTSNSLDPETTLLTVSA